MTVTANTTRNDYTAGENQVDYEYTFQIHQASDVDVYLNGVKQTLNTHYTIDDIGNATGGTVTFTLLDANGLPTSPAENAIINIVMAMDLDRDTNYQPSGAFLAADVNNDFDRLWHASNQQQTEINRSLRLQDTDVTTSSFELPLKDARKGKLLGFNAITGDPEASVVGNSSSWDVAYDNMIVSAAFTGGSYTLTQQDGGTISTSIDGRYLQLAGGTLTGDLNVGFNKLTVGRVEIEGVVGDHSIIKETGGGDLQLQGTNLKLLTGDGSASFIECTANGGVNIFNNGTARLSATIGGAAVNGGLLVSGTLNASGYNDSNWNTAYGWGDHSQAGYLTSYTETDPVFSAHVASGITSTNISNWNDAYNNKITAVNYSGQTLTLTQQDGGTLTTTINGGIGQWTTTGNDIYYNTGNVGIGTTSPTSKLTLTGTGGDTSGIAFKSSNEQVKAYFTNDNADSDFSITYVGSSSAEVKLKHNGNVHLCESAGNVGIGVSSAQESLHTVGNIRLGSTAPARIYTASTELRLGVDSDNNNDTSNITFYTNNDEKVRIDKDGNVGIGTTNPASTVHIQAPANALQLNNADEDTYMKVCGNRAQFGYRASDGFAIVQGAGGKGIAFGVNNATFGSGEVMRIKSDGKVGIGTTAPTQPVHIQATTNIPLKIETTHTGGNSRLEFANDTYRKSIGVNTDGKFTIYDVTNNKTPFSIVNNSENNALVISGSNVGIGTASPSTKLDVNGDVAVRGSVPLIFLEETDTTNLNTSLANNSGAFNIDTANDGNTAGTTRLSVDHATGDITFHGATDSMFFDASAGNLGLGTTTPASAIHISETTPIIRLEDTNYTNKIGEIKHSNGVTSIQSRNNTANGEIVFERNNGSATSESMRINSSGDVLIGTTAGIGKLVVDSGASAQNALFKNSTTGSIITFEDSTASGTYAASVGGIGNQLTFVTNGTEKVRIDSSGNMGIGTNAPATKLHVAGQISASDGTNSAPAYTFADDTDTGMYSPAADTIAWAEGGVERMRLDNSGKLFLGTTSVGGWGARLRVTGRAEASGFVASSNSSLFLNGGSFGSPTIECRSYTSYSSSIQNIMRFANLNGTQYGSITITNATTQYNVSSDERLKENITDAEDAGSKIDAIRIRQFDWKEGGHHEDYGVIAQELKPVAPEAVTEGYSEEDIWSVDYSKLVPTLIKEIQSLRNRVAELENN